LLTAGEPVASWTPSDGRLMSTELMTLAPVPSKAPGLPGGADDSPSENTSSQSARRILSPSDRRVRSILTPLTSVPLDVFRSSRMHPSGRTISLACCLEMRASGIVMSHCSDRPTEVKQAADASALSGAMVGRAGERLRSRPSLASRISLGSPRRLWRIGRVTTIGSPPSPVAAAVPPAELLWELSREGRARCSSQPARGNRGGDARWRVLKPSVSSTPACAAPSGPVPMRPTFSSTYASGTARARQAPCRPLREPGRGDGPRGRRIGRATSLTDLTLIWTCRRARRPSG